MTFRVVRNLWVVCDVYKLYHQAVVTRYFDDVNDYLAVFTVATACHPRHRREENRDLLDWKTKLPPVRLGPNFITDWNVHAVINCMECIVSPFVIQP
jgi:hypothetical protein